MIINSKQSLSDAIIQIENDFEKYRWLQLKISKGSRTLKQNAWINLAYEMLSKQGDMTTQEYRRHCKYHFGLPILFANDRETAKMWWKALKNLTYEERLLAMDFVEVTRNFSVEEGIQYINEISNHFNDKRLPEKEGL